MENEGKQNTSDDAKRHSTVDYSEAPSYNHRRDGEPPARSPEDSPDHSSISSDQTSLSHGFSPRDEEVQASPEVMPMSPPITVMNRYVWEEQTTTTTKPDPGVGEGFYGGASGSGGRRSRPSLSILRRTKIETEMKKAALGFRVFGFLFCLISFSVMATDKNKGWALDSFYRYTEFRYCMSVNVIGFVYSGIQGLDLAYHLATGHYAIRHQLRYYLDFALDQMLAYLLISASSSAATRIEDWVSNWGNDAFPEMATISVAMSFLAFVAFASSSLISGYALCTFQST